MLGGPLQQLSSTTSPRIRATATIARTKVLHFTTDLLASVNVLLTPVTVATLAKSGSATPDADACVLPL